MMLKELLMARSAEDDPSWRHMLGIRCVELKHEVARKIAERRISHCLEKGSAEQKTVSASRTQVLQDSSGHYHTSPDDIVNDARNFYEEF